MEQQKLPYMPEQYSLIKHTNKWLTRPRFETEREPHLYPSEASVEVPQPDGSTKIIGGCHRAAWLRMTGVAKTNPSDAFGLRVMGVGIQVENWLQSEWKGMGILVASNKKFYWAEHNISGELDAVLTEPDTGIMYGVEVKSFYGYYAGKQILGNKSQKGEPKETQLLQTLVYAYYFKDRLPYFRMFYMERGDGQVKEFIISVKEVGGVWYPVIDGQLQSLYSMDDVIERYQMLNEYVNNENLPPRDYDKIWTNARVEMEREHDNIGKTRYAKWQKDKKKYPIGDWNCQYCNYKEFCYEKDGTPKHG